ncbi:MAG: Uma2 family endonuclease [Leptolyngbya sp. SIO4C1]|nr:Uma2 family endonuclease [Leptolyngbya sp. SIO4C1]
MVQARPQSITLETFLALPETKPASEYIDGHIIQKPMPQGKHSTVQRDFTMTVEVALKPGCIGRAFPELRCTFGGRSIVPDVSVFIWSHIPRDVDGTIANQFAILPDWVVEILSPDQSHTKVTKNILHCLKHGTQLGWLIDPDEQTIFVYNPDRSLHVFDLESPNDRLPVPEFASDINLTVQTVMNWLIE